MDIFRYNSAAWDNEVLIGNTWTKAVSSDQTEKAKNGEYHIFLSLTKSIPSSWLNNISGKKFFVSHQEAASKVLFLLRQELRSLFLMLQKNNLSRMSLLPIEMV